MAGIFSHALDKLGNKQRFENILHVICVRHGLNRADFLQAEEDFMSGRIKLAFKAAIYPPDLVRAAMEIHNIANDKFRGEIVRAAVPEFSKSAIALSDAILNPKNRIIYIDPDDPEFKKL